MMKGGGARGRRRGPDSPTLSSHRASIPHSALKFLSRSKISKGGPRAEGGPGPSKWGPQVLRKKGGGVGDAGDGPKTF